jgi:hypothetical protein
MQFQKVHVSIVRSIRQVSLVRDWQRARGENSIPRIADFVPNERAGDAVDILINEVHRGGGRLSYLCQVAGDRAVQVFGEALQARFLHECLDAPMARAVQPIWDACIHNRLPVYSIVPVMDPDGVPVTLEQIFLPYGRRDGTEADVMVAALHAWSTEGRFAHRGLLRNIAKTPLHWAVLVDPSMANAARPTVPPLHAGDEIVLD